jgi:4-diphosphocytidyl-2C-methyl-D-erythritol kinase
MTTNRKERVRQLAGKLQSSTAEEAQQVKEMVGLLLEDAKHNLVSAEGAALIRLQGEARALQRIYEQLTTSRRELPTREQ